MYSLPTNSLCLMHFFQLLSLCFWFTFITSSKTALAREISRALRARKPKIVAAPELLDRWVGGSERLVRELFAGAEAELRECNGDVTKSALHVIVIDEIDAVFRKRSSTSDSDTGEATRSSVVNQILAKVNSHFRIIFFAIFFHLRCLITICY